MKRSFLLLFLLFFCILLNAQIKMDSLWNIWNNESLDDSIRIVALKKIAWDGYLFSKPDSAYYYAQIMYDFAEKKERKKNMVSALNIQGLSLSNRGDYHKALRHFQKCLMLAEKISYKHGVATSLNNIGLLYGRQGDYPKAVIYFQRCVKIYEEMSDQNGLAMTLNNIGLLYGRQGENSKALNYFCEVPRCVRKYLIQEELPQP